MRKRKIAARRASEDEKKKCKDCGEMLPIEEFRLTTKRKNGKAYTYRASKCYSCTAKQQRDSVVITVKNISKVTCVNNCIYYPCFAGIEGMKSNLAATCTKFRRHDT